MTLNPWTLNGKQHDRRTVCQRRLLHPQHRSAITDCSCGDALDCGGAFIRIRNPPVSAGDCRPRPGCRKPGLATGMRPSSGCSRIPDSTVADPAYHTPRLSTIFTGACHRNPRRHYAGHADYPQVVFDSGLADRPGCHHARGRPGKRPGQPGCPRETEPAVAGLLPLYFRHRTGVSAPGTRG